MQNSDCHSFKRCEWTHTHTHTLGLPRRKKAVCVRWWRWYSFHFNQLFTTPNMWTNEHSDHNLFNRWWFKIHQIHLNWIQIMGYMCMSASCGNSTNRIAGVVHIILSNTSWINEWWLQKEKLYVQKNTAKQFLKVN